MNLLGGLEKFGIKAKDPQSLYEEEAKPAQADAQKEAEREKERLEREKRERELEKARQQREKEKELARQKEQKKQGPPDENSLLLDKSMHCPVCDKAFKAKVPKSGRVKRIGQDIDLRPHFDGVDSLKYSVISCPYCGYSAMSRYFDHLSNLQIKMIHDEVSSGFKPEGDPAPKLLSYDESIERYKLSLYCTIVKKGKASEKAYNCLNLAWVYRGKYATLDPEDPALEEERKDCREQEEAYYEQAYEGFTKAISTENYPICGMDESTLDYLMAAMSMHFKKYDMASKCISRIKQSPSASKTVKDRADDLKDRLMAEIKKSK